MNSATRKPPVGKATVVKALAGLEPGHRRRLPTTVSLLATCLRLRRPPARHAQVTALASSEMTEFLQTGRSSIPAVGHHPTLAAGGFRAPHLHLAQCNLAARSALPSDQSRRLRPGRLRGREC